MSRTSAPGKQPDLLALWKDRTCLDPRHGPAAAVRLAEQLMSRGEPFLAYDLASHALEVFPGQFRLRQLMGLALARTGAPAAAQEILEGLYAGGHQDEETIGLLARTFKDRWLSSPDTAEGRQALHRAFDLYLEGFRSNPEASWTGINAATLALLMGRSAVARSLAGQVEGLCRRGLEHAGAGSQRYWLLATLGEAALIRGRRKEAQDLYLAARAEAGNRWGDLASTRRNARILSDRIGLPWEELAPCFAVPPVVVFAGHMIDLPGRPQPRFPRETVARVDREMRKRVKAIQGGFAYTAAAQGGDLLFLAAAQEAGMETHVILPENPDLFIRHSVAYPGDPAWERRFHRLCGRAGTVTVVSEGLPDQDPGGYEYASMIQFGLALEKAERLGARIFPLALWDGRTGDGPGGTRFMVDFWRGRGVEVEIIDPLEPAAKGAKGIRAGAKTEAPAKTGASKRASPERLGGTPGRKTPTAMKAILFADAVSFSKLQELQIPAFIAEFLALVGKCVQESRWRIAFRNTWGDGFFFVFHDLRHAGLFALDLADRVNATDWGGKGLPEQLNLRIALHAGPVFPFDDPVTGKHNFLGAHVNRAARIEPITPPGQVYTTQAFATVALTQGIREFACEYVGQVPLAKSFGIFPLYHLKRISGPARGRAGGRRD